MVDVGHKPVTQRRALARGAICMNASTLERIERGDVAKGDVLAVARVAGIQAAKETARWIPLCHPLPLDSVQVEFHFQSPRLVVTAVASTSSRTGVEMEALTAVSATLLTVYDMCKGVDRGMTIEQIRLEEKVGGQSGHWRRSDMDGSARP